MMDACVVETLKRRKTSGATAKGIDSMHGKRDKRKLREEAAGKKMNTSHQKVNKRSSIKTAPSKEEQCSMAFTIFCSKVSALNHKRPA